MQNGHLLRPGCEEPFSLRQIKTLIWAQAAVGAALFIGMFWSVCTSQGLVLLGCAVCVIGWVLSFRPLAHRARRIGRHSGSRPDWHDLLLILWGTAQFASLCFDFMNLRESFLINLTANFFLLLLLVLRGWMSISMKVPLSRSTWYWAMAIAGVSFVVRASLVVMVILAFSRC